MSRRYVLAAAWALPLLGGFRPMSAEAATGKADPAILDRVADYLNRITTLDADFTQFAPDGAMTSGKFFLSRPGRLRFDYEPPSKLLIVADGTWIVVNDRGLKTIDRYPIGSTPLDILLEKQVDFSRLDVLATEKAGNVLRIQVRDKKEPAKGDLTLVVEDAPLQIRQWVVRDAQGLQTTVTLENLRSNIPLEPRLFVLNDPFPQRR